MNKNVMIGGGVVALGLFLAIRAKKKGKTVPFIGKFLPVKQAVITVPAPAPATAPAE